MTVFNKIMFRDSRIVQQAVQGATLEQIAQAEGIGKTTVEKALKNPYSQKLMGDLLQEVEQNLNAQLPELVQLSLDHLMQVMKSESFGSGERKTKAAFQILRTATALTKKATFKNAPHDAKKDF